MPSPPAYDDLLVHLDRWHVRYKVTKGARTRHRPASVGGWGPLNLVANHHDASRAGTPAVICNRTLKQGRPDLEGPLSQFSVGRHGKVFLIGFGRCNGVGTIRPGVLKRAVEEREPLRPTGTSGETVDGNTHSWNIEVHNNGLGEKYGDPQLLSLILLNAALLDLEGWSANSSIQHYELTLRKVDMHAIRRHKHDNAAGPWLRAEIAVALRAGPGKYTHVGWRPGVVPPPPPPPPPLPDCTHCCPRHCTPLPTPKESVHG